MSKILKRVFSLVLVTVAAVALVACGGESPEKKLESDWENLEIKFLGGDTKDNVKSGLFLPVVGSKGSKITWKSNSKSVDATTGVVSRLEDGKTEDVVLTATLTMDKDGVTLTKTKDFDLVLHGTTLYSYNDLVAELVGGKFYSAAPEVRLALLATLEKYLIEQQISIPLISNSAAVKYSNRVTLPVTEDGVGVYTPVLGFNALKGTVTPLNGEKVYRNSASGFPKTLNHLAYADSAESDVLGLIMGSLFEFDYTDYAGGDYKFSIKNAMAASFEALDEGYDANDPENNTSSKWKITLRDDLYWQAGEYTGTNGKVVTVEENTQIKAADFLYTYQELLSPWYKFRRANAFYGSTFQVVGAEDYYKQTAEKPVSFDSVGFKAVADDDLSFTIELANKVKEFDFKYNLSSFVVSPVNKDVFEANATNKGKAGATNAYGSSVDKVVGHGPYRLTKWEDKQTLTYEKNVGYFGNKADSGLTPYNPDKITTTYVADSTAALQLFEAGNIDVVSIPASTYDQHKADALKVPGTTTFRLSVNMASQFELDQVTAGAWKAKPILQELAFREALYFALDRTTLSTEIGKVWTPAQSYFSDAYLSAPEIGQVFRETDAGKGVIAGLSPNTNGYSTALAKKKLDEALDSLVSKGLVKQNEKIELELALFDGATWESAGAWMKNQLESILVSDKYPNIKITIKPTYHAGLDVYYEKQMPGKFDLAIAGISGGTLDPYSFMDVFQSDNVSGLFFNYGFHSSIRNIDVEKILADLEK